MQSSFSVAHRDMTNSPPSSDENGYAEIEGISVVVPAFNEETGIGPVVIQLYQVLNACDYDHEIIVVDDGSTDATAAQAEAAGVRVLRHAANRGYSAALKTGITGRNNGCWHCGIFTLRRQSLKSLAC